MKGLNRYTLAFTLFICILCGCSTEYIPVGNKPTENSSMSTCEAPDFSVSVEDIQDTTIKVTIGTNYNSSDSVKMPDILKVSLVDPDSKKWPVFTHVNYDLKWTFSGKPIRFHLFEHYYSEYVSTRNDTTYLVHPAQYVYLTHQQKVIKLVKGNISGNDSLNYVSCSSGNWFFRTNRYSKPAYLNVRILYSLVKGRKRDTIARVFPFIKIQTND